ncbi:MAG: serine protease [Candidatus Pseudobacter hemicellulosilyticus]|uniref:Serine protease n=1 Tax=Candidatus Pseudobacter hemicellulosilyticus TaxID=3121375 RepID=A0AAJ5WQ34_9BACT|nr:MAG: serine protease [Pseudobacter sp.]
MKWNELLTELNYYLANLYLWDTTNATKIRLTQKAGLPAMLINWQLPPVDVWFSILKNAADRDKVDVLLTGIITDGNENDEQLIGARDTVVSGRQPASQPLKSEWKGGTMDKAQKEKILGRRSTLLPIGFLEEGTAAAKAVVRIEVGNESGTGFIIESGWLLTNNHVLPNREIAGQAMVQFGYQLPAGIPVDQKRAIAVKAESVARLDPGTEADGRFFTNKEQDWTLVKLEPREPAYPHLFFSKQPAQEGDFVNIIQHPLGGPKQIGIYNNLVMFAGDGILQYMTDTNDGSSGSPVFNSNWEVVAIHHSGGWVKDGQNGTPVKRNQGTPISIIKTFITDHQLCPSY